MKKIDVFLLAVLPATAQNAKPFLGRWDITLTPATGSPYPGWMEVTEKDGKIEGRYQPRGGAWQPFAGASIENQHLIVTMGGGRGPATTWDFIASGKSLTGVQKRSDTEGPKLAAVRAP